MVGMCEHGGNYDEGWLHLTKGHRLFGLETWAKELLFAQKPNHFSSILGSRASQANVFHSKSKPSEWDPCPIQLRHPNTYTMSNHAYIWSQWSDFHGCNICDKWCEISNLFTLMGIDHHGLLHIKYVTHRLAMKNTRFVKIIVVVDQFSCKEQEVQNILLGLLDFPIFVSSLVVWLNHRF